MLNDAAERPEISVVLPIYRTADSLGELYTRLKAALEPLGSFELLMVDDGSPDNAWQLMMELAKQDARVKAIRLSRNFGQHPAIAAGFERARGKNIVLMDADLEERPENIPVLLRALTPDLDVVYTVKQNEAKSFVTRITSYLYHYVFSRLTNTQVPGNIGTMRIFSNRFLKAVLSYPERNILFGPLMFHAGFASATVPVQHDQRKHGRSGYTFRKRLAMAFNSLLSYTDLPHRFLMNAGTFVLIASLLYALALVIGYLIVKTPPPPGLTLLALLITTSMGIMMLSFGIIGAYIFRVYQEVLCRPRYIVARTINVAE